MSIGQFLVISPFIGNEGVVVGRQQNTSDPIPLSLHMPLYCALCEGGSIMAVGYLEAFSKIWDHCWIEWNERGPTKTFLTDFINEVSSYGFISAKDIFFCLALGVAFTLLRYFLTAAIFKVGIASF